MTIAKSFRVAFRGLITVWREERSFQIQTAVALCVIVFVIVLPLKPWEIILLLLNIVAVLALEIINTVVEKFVDMVKPRLHTHAGIIKDMMAGAVLLVSASAAVIGLIILVPHLIVFVIQ